MFLACSPGLPFLTLFSEISPWGDTASHGLLVSGPFPVGGLDVDSGKSTPGSTGPGISYHRPLKKKPLRHSLL